jgi:hypothetical protein
MKFDKNVYEGLVRRPLMMVKKSEENSRVLALNGKVGENCFLERTTRCPVHI